MLVDTIYPIIEAREAPGDPPQGESQAPQSDTIQAELL